MLTVTQIIERDRKANRRKGEPKKERNAYERKVFVPEIRKRLPTKDKVLVCDDFRRMGMKFKCCETCHTFYSHFDMTALRIMGNIAGTRKDDSIQFAWVCDSVRRLLKPPSRRRSLREEKLLRKIFGVSPRTNPKPQR